MGVDRRAVAAMFVRVRGGLGPAQVGAAVETVLAAHGAVLLDRAPLDAGRRANDWTVVGITVSPDSPEWIEVEATTGRPEHDLAEYLAVELDTPVVVASLYETCEPDVQHTLVCGAGPDYDGLVPDLLADTVPAAGDVVCLTFGFDTRADRAAVFHHADCERCGPHPGGTPRHSWA